MTIVVNPHNPAEEQQLLSFLDNMKYDYTKQEELEDILTPEQIAELEERERLYEAGEMEAYSLEEFMAHVADRTK